MINQTNTINDGISTDSKNLNVVTDFNTKAADVNGNEWDYILGFFNSAFKDPIAAEKFTQEIYQVGSQSGVNPLDIIKTMEGQTGIELNMSLAYYLNGIRSNTTLLGIHNIIKPNYYAGRSVLI